MKAVMIALALIAPAAFGATRTWTGGAGAKNNVWSNPANWDSGVPKSDDDVVLPAASGDVVNDLPPGLQLHSLTVGSTTFVSGNEIFLGAGGLYTSGFRVSILSIGIAFTSITLTDSQSWASSPNGSFLGVSPTNIKDKTLTLSSAYLHLGPISGSGAIIQNGGSTDTVFENYSGVVTVNGGSFLLRGGAADTTLVNGGLLELVGSPSLASITVSGGGALQLDGVARSGNLAFRAVRADVQRLSVSIGESSVGGAEVAGSVALGNAMLELTRYGEPITTAAPRMIIDNDGIDPVLGTFLGLPEGAVVNAGSQSFRISYTGGSGNDVTLTLAPPASDTAVALTSSPSPSRSGETVVLTATVSGTTQGSVRFYDGGVLLGTSPIDGSGRAALATPLTSDGWHKITAAFSGFGPSASSFRTNSQYVLPTRTRAARR